MFQGSGVALVTPMKNNAELDKDKLADLVSWHLKQGTNALIVNGTTGEAATLSEEEQASVITLVCEVVNKRIPVIAGTGTHSTAGTIKRTQQAYRLGADASLIVTPYYNRPLQKGLIQHYQAVADQVKFPLILYNVPTRTACDLLPETVGELSKIPQIIGIKEATNLTRLQQLKQSCRAGFLLYSGDDSSALEFMAQGGHGVISVTANVAPALMQQMCHLALTNQIKAAKAIDEKLSLLHRVLGIEPNPIPVKWALSQLGKIDQGIRLPLTPLSNEYHAPVRQALAAADLF